MVGIISTTPIAFSEDQLIRRVPLSSCKNPDNGVIGKCCRDPNYVDPWPAGNLPANYSGGFDDQGFPKFLNIGKNKQPQPSGTISKTSFSSIRPQLPIGSESVQSTQFTAPKLPTITTVHQPIIPRQPQLPSLPIIPNQPRQPVFPTLPNIPQQPIFNAVKKTISHPKNNYDTASSNENPTILESHIPGSKCGVRHHVQKPEGLGPIDVAFGEIPWQAMILLTSEKRILCSGAIVAPNAVVTAARCVEGFNPDVISIKAGEWKLGYELKHEEPLPFEIIKVVSIAPYPEYNSQSPANDVAILFLEHDIKMDKHVDMICLPEVQQPEIFPTGRNCISTGWGKTEIQLHAAGALMHSLEVDLLDNEECLRRINNAENQIQTDSSLVCAKAHRKSNNMCQVDMGGPLACDRGDGQYELVGVYSQDTGCLPTNQVATFAAIDRPWVEQMMAHPPPIRAVAITKSELPSPVVHQQPIIHSRPIVISESELPLPIVRRVPIIHDHGPEQVCDCQKSNLRSEDNQYLPPL